MDVVGLQMAKADAAKKRAKASRQLFGMLPGPICAGRAIKAGSFSALTAVTFQRIFTMYSDAPQIRLAFPLFGLPGSADTTPEQFGGPLTIKASVIWNYNAGSGGTSIPVTFNGGIRSVTTAMGQTLMVSDPIDVPPSQGANTAFIVRTYITQAPRTFTDGVTTSGSPVVTSATAGFISGDVNATISGTGIPGGATIGGVSSATSINLSANATATATGVSITITPKYLPIMNAPFNGISRGGTYNPSNWYEGYLAGDFTDLATNDFSTATNDATTHYGPIVCGWPSSGQHKTTLLAGDSIMAGTNWQSESNAFSFASWALHQAGIGAVNLAHSGEKLHTVLATYAAQRGRLTLASPCPNALDEYGINDVFTGTSSAAQMKSDLLTWWGYLSKKGCTVWRTTLTPRSTGTWLTTAGQTLFTGIGYEQIRQTVNQWLRAPASAGAGNSAAYDAAQAGITFGGIFDVAAALEINSDGSAITINPATGAISNGTGGYWLVQSTTYATGTVTSIPNASRLVDSTKSWTSNQWTDYAMTITADATTPASVGQALIVAGNNGTQLTSDSSWTTTPSVGASYALIKVFTADGTHPTTFGHLLAAAKVDTTKLTAA